MGNKLELTWVGKNKQEKIEPRMLLLDKEKSYGDEKTENMLIHGDNLLALKALVSEYSGKIKCVYIDPPYNTGSAFEHYDDNLEHSIWLNLMKYRLELLRELLSDDGLIWIQIDDGEMAYLKVLCDEIFGRNNFINSISIKVSPPNGVKMQHAEKKILKEKEYILVYSKKKECVKFNREYIKVDSWDSHYNKYIKGDLNNISSCKVLSINDVLKENHLIADINNDKFNKWIYENKNRVFQPVGLAKIKDVEKYNKDCIVPIEENPGYFAYKGRQVQLIENSIKETNDGFVLARLVCDLWTDIAFNNLFQEGNGDFKSGKKPEKLLKRIINMSTIEGDFVLDSFLGSGSTCAVAHKMNRKWIGIEMGDHCYSHCIPRINDVINGKDMKGISELVNWKGGGGYRFYEVAPTLIKKDAFGEPIINYEYNAEMLASAVALHEGFKYNPSKEKFWKQSKGNEKSYLYVTTKFLNREDIENIKTDMEDNEFLIIACTAYDKDIDGLYKNIKIKKIPEMLLAKCEFGKENYNLNIINPPEYKEEIEHE